VKRDTLEAARGELSAVANDHIVQGFSELSGPYGTIATNPIVTDIVDAALFANLSTSASRTRTPAI
jgi:hypothetical protein